MKLKRTTLGLIASALILGGFVYFYDIQGTKTRTEVQAKEKQLFKFEENEVQSFTVQLKDETLAFERDENSKWQMKQPQEIPANEAVVAFLLDLLAKGQANNTFIIPANQRQDYGLDTPLATIKVNLKTGQKHELNLGKQNFDGKSIYAEIDPSNSSENVELVLVPVDFQYAVERELVEWIELEESSESDTSTDGNK
ncbi:MAG: DUF4340 domain-containing protein [Halothece sp.]